MFFPIYMLVIDCFCGLLRISYSTPMYIYSLFSYSNFLTKFPFSQLDIIVKILISKNRIKLTGNNL